MKKVLVLLVLTMFVNSPAFSGTDFQIIKILNADNEKQKPAVYEVVTIVDAVDQDGKSVKIRGAKQTMTIPKIDQQINHLESILARLKTVRSEMESQFVLEK